MDQCLQVALVTGTDAIARQSNFIFSPLSLRAALALLAAGTNGETLRELLTFLGSQELHLLNAASAGLIAEMRAWPQLSFAAGIFADRSLSLRLDLKATWAPRFDPSDTVRREFKRLDGSTPVRVPFLSDTGMQYATSFDDHGFKVLQCFYKMVRRDGKLDRNAPLFSMLIFLPPTSDKGNGTKPKENGNTSDANSSSPIRHGSSPAILPIVLPLVN